MKRHALAKIVVIASSMLLLGAFVAYRATGYAPFVEKSIEPRAESAAEKKPVVMSGSKSMVIAPQETPAQAEMKSSADELEVEVLPSSKSAPLLHPRKAKPRQQAVQPRPQ